MKSGIYITLDTNEITSPQYEHDCECCIFLGHYEDTIMYCDQRPTKVDLYYCPQGKRPTVISRHSSEGADYSSGLVFAQWNRPGCGLAEALKRAKALDLYHTN